MVSESIVSSQQSKVAPACPSQCRILELSYRMCEKVKKGCGEEIGVDLMVIDFYAHERRRNSRKTI